MKIYLQTTTVSSSVKQQYALRNKSVLVQNFLKKVVEPKSKTNKETYKYILPPVLSQIHIFDK
jgi:hypothetical protein